MTGTFEIRLIPFGFLGLRTCVSQHSTPGCARAALTPFPAPRPLTCHTHPPTHHRTELTPHYVRLLRDSEAEVRVAAAGKVSSFSKFLTPQLIVAHIIPCVRELSMDSSQ